MGLWELEIKFESQNIEKLFESEKLRIKSKKKGILKIYLRMKFLKIWLERKWSCENLFEGDILKKRLNSELGNFVGELNLKIWILEN